METTDVDANGNLVIMFSEQFYPLKQIPGLSLDVINFYGNDILKLDYETNVPMNN